MTQPPANAPWTPPAAPSTMPAPPPPPAPYQPAAPGWASHGGEPVVVTAPSAPRRLPGYLLAGAGVLGMVAAALPWLTLSGPAAATFEAALEASDNGLGGLERDGALTIVFALVAVVAGLVRARRRAPKASAITGLVAGGLTVLVAAIDIADVSSTKDEIPFLASAELTVGVGIGLWLTLVAGLAIAGASLLALLQRGSRAG